MTKLDHSECHGCKISMFCRGKDKETIQPCETNLKAVLVAFVAPLAGIVLILTIAQDRWSEIHAALGILAFLSVYFLAIWLMKPRFRNRK